MPELPEVQTVINYLKDNILNKKIISVDILKDKFLKNSTPSEFKKEVENNKIINIWRKGKYLLFDLSNEITIVNHLRMEGKFFVSKEKIKNKHNYLYFELENSTHLIYNDTRQFGTFHISKTNELNNLKEIKKLAIDPLDKDFNTNYLFNKIKNINKTIKTTLLDQTIVSGIGNIYANEILFLSKINPFTKCKELTIKDVEKICLNSTNILQQALKYKGTTIQSFSFGSDQHIGEFQRFLKVQSRENEKCLDCGYLIVREKDNGRSSFYCPNCQK